MALAGPQNLARTVRRCPPTEGALRRHLGSTSAAPHADTVRANFGMVKYVLCQM